jgi:EpsI family protein
MSTSNPDVTTHGRNEAGDLRLPGDEGISRLRWSMAGLFAIAFVALYWRSAGELYTNWTLTDSYYTHGFLVPFISAYFIWKDRAILARLPIRSSVSGLAWILVAALLLLLGDYLGFRVLAQFSMIPMLAGMVSILLGSHWTRRLWFPLFFLIFMIPIPPSLTQNIALRLKLLAAQSAVMLANAMTLPMVQEGSWIHFGDDRLLVGDVCGGLRSLIALLALGAIFAYISKVQTWAKLLIIVMAGPIAVVANIVRIFFLCVVGYLWGSEVAGGKVHDYSGILIFAVAILLFTALDAPLRRLAPSKGEEDESKAPARGRESTVRSHRVLLPLTLSILVAATAGHLGILRAQAQVRPSAIVQADLNVPTTIVDYAQDGVDFSIDDRTREILEASTILIRNYRSPRGRPIQLSIVHAGTTRRSLHFPEVCLVGDGWEIIKQEDVSVGILFTGRRLVLMKADKYEAVLYWFKTGDYVTGNFFANALYWAKNQMTMGDQTSAMIKISTPVVSDGEAAAFAALDDFAMKFAPIMMKNIR